MAFLWDKGIKIMGNKDPHVSPYLKAWIKQGNTCVCGVFGEGATKEIQANWNSPFEEDTIGGKFQKVGGLMQATTGRTSKSKLSSLQIWEGNRPHSFNLALKLYALKDAKAEVMDPLKELEKMLSPEVNEKMPGGRIPQPVWINIGRNAVYGDCLIVSMTVPLDKEKTSQGYLVRAEAQLQIETRKMLNRSDIDRTYG